VKLCICSLRTTLCVRFKSEVVACGIIFLAARRKQVCPHTWCHRFIRKCLSHRREMENAPWPHQPETPEVPPAQVVLPERLGDAWWELCSVSRADVLEVASEIHALYSQPAPVYVALGRAAPGASVPRVSSLAAAASPISVPASPQGGPPAAGAAAAAGGEGSAMVEQLPNGATASADGDAGGVGGASAGRSDSRGPAASGPEQVSVSTCLAGWCGDDAYVLYFAAE
jgi:cyclin L